MIVQSITSMLTGHIDVIHTNDYWCKIETVRTFLFSKRRQTWIYEIVGSDWELDSRPVARLAHHADSHAKDAIRYHKNIVDYLDGLGEDGNDITLEEAFEMMIVCFGEYGEWKLVKSGT